MKFMNEDFLLSTETAKKIFLEIKDLPIFDYHCHLSPKEIWENREPQNITQLWLYGDHYKWRVMRSCGVDEKYITGNSSDYEKFLAYATVLPCCIGNPLYHWSHLELQRYFGIYDTLNGKNAKDIWEKTCQKISQGGYSPRAVIDRSNVFAVCTTDDPADGLEYHKLLHESGWSTRVLPAFRPDKALGIDKPGFRTWLKTLGEAAQIEIHSFREMKAALAKRMDFFDEMGCVASDHALTMVPYAEASDEELELIFANEKLTALQIEQYKTALLRFLASEYYKRGWAMELHIGALRDNNTQCFLKHGPDSGFDSVADCAIAYKLSRLMDSMGDQLPKTILFALNPKDNVVLGTMIGNFPSSKMGGKLQFGSAWWFNDSIDGMRTQMKDLANWGVFGTFIGMLTDSRSFLSYPRHEYFRRLLAQMLGEWVERGEYPEDWETLISIAKDISFYNARRYFSV